MVNSHSCCSKRLRIPQDNILLIFHHWQEEEELVLGVVLMNVVELILCSDIPFSSKRCHAEQAKELIFCLNQDI